ncbi:MAG: hypothetical protein WDN24_08465 [Sphingomonas sp.]
MAFIDGYYRDAPKIFVRTRKRDGERREMYLPLVRAFDHPGIDWWFRDFCVAVPDNITPRLPRREAKLRVWGTRLPVALHAQHQVKEGGGANAPPPTFAE